MLVPGDIISIKLGDIIPADARLLHRDPLKIDQVCDTQTNMAMFGPRIRGELCNGKEIFRVNE